MIYVLVGARILVQVTIYRRLLIGRDGNSVTLILAGCNTTSYIQTCDNKSARTILQNTPGLIETLITITEDPQCLTLESVHKEPIERYVVLVYSNTSGSIKYVNDARYIFFFDNSRYSENIPPTLAALFDHLKRSVLQACFICKQSTITK